MLKRKFAAFFAVLMSFFIVPAHAWNVADVVKEISGTKTAIIAIGTAVLAIMALMFAYSLIKTMARGRS